MSKKLTFGDLEIGDRLIGFPVSGDNEGHGGFLGYHNVFIKIPAVNDDGIERNVVNMSTGFLSNFPDSMNVIKISK